MALKVPGSPSSDIVYIEDMLKDGLRDNSEPRISKNIHVSNLFDFCPREYALVTSRGFNYNTPQKVYPGLALTFAFGHAIHDIVQSALETSGIMKVREIQMELPEYGVSIVGTADGLLEIVGNEKYNIVEIKSISAENFSSLCEPQLAHEVQLSHYLWLAKKLKMSAVNPDFGYVLYVSKGHNTKPFKIYRIDRNENVCKDTEKKMKQIKKFSEKGTIPKRTCAHHRTLMAKRCTATKFCFEEEK